MSSVLKQGYCLSAIHKLCLAAWTEDYAEWCKAIVFIENKKLLSAEDMAACLYLEEIIIHGWLESKTHYQLTGADAYAIYCITLEATLRRRHGLPPKNTFITF